MHKKVNYWQFKSCGRMSHTRYASSTCCATPRRQPSRLTSRSKRPCANACSPRSERCVNRSRNTWPRPRLASATQLAVLDDYATGILTALNTDGLQPFKYATVEASVMLEEIEASLRHLCEKKGP